MRMEFNRILRYVFLIFHFINNTMCFEPVSFTTSALAGVGSYMYSKLVCRYKECCTDNEIPGDYNKLEKLLKSKVYGQHLAQDIVLKSLKAHWSNNVDSPKALTLSFHGWPGSGKNYVTGFIKEALYTLGSASDHIHHFNARINFPDESKVPIYQLDLYDWIKSNVTKCPKQLFVFDEVDKMPPNLMNIIKPLIDYNAYIGKTDYRKSIFIFLSNTGASLITERMIKLYQSGVQRKDVKLEDLENLILKGAFNEPGGFHHSDTIKSNLIDHYIPFLPMELEHVRECILDQFRIRNIFLPSDADVESVMDVIEWGPSPENLYSKTGCKRISQKVGVIAQKYRY